MTQKITHILFTTDLSENSTYALTHTVSLAKATGAKLHVLHVLEPLSDDAKVTIQMFVQDSAARADALNARKRQVKTRLAERQKAFWSALSPDDQIVQDQIESVEVVEGYPAEVILRRCGELGCDLIVLGSHDHGFSHTFLGTVAKRVLRRASVPTLVVPFSEEA